MKSKWISLFRYPTLVLQVVGSVLSVWVSLGFGLTAAEAGAVLFFVQVGIGAVNAWAVRPIAPAAFTALVPAVAGLLTAFHLFTPSTQLLDSVTSLISVTLALVSSLLTTPAYDPAPPSASIVTSSPAVVNRWIAQGVARAVPATGDGVSGPNSRRAD